MPKAFREKIVSANALLSGEVVYLTASGAWTADIVQAAVALDQAVADDLLARAQAQQSLVVGPYLADVALDDDGRPFPRHFRERFRLRGPSHRPDLGKQAHFPPRQTPLSAGGGV